MHLDWHQPTPHQKGASGTGCHAEQLRTGGTVMHGLRRDVVLRAAPSWEGIVEVEQHRAPPEEISDFQVTRHTIILHLGPPHLLAWGLTGATRQCTFVPVDNLTLITAGTRLGWRCDQAIEALVVALDRQFVSALAHRSAQGKDVEFLNLVAFEDTAITHILRAMQTALRERCSASRLYGESLTAALVSHLLGYYSAPPIKLDNPTGGLPPARLRRVLDYIEAHLGEDTSLRQLAELVRLSPDHFAALFRQSIGLPPHRYVLERRIVRAKELLAGDRLTLAEIGYALGYTSQPHFITMFRKLTGMTPGAYRKVGRHKHAAQGVAAYSGFPEDP